MAAGLALPPEISTGRYKRGLTVVRRQYCPIFATSLLLPGLRQRLPTTQLHCGKQQPQQLEQEREPQTHGKGTSMTNDQPALHGLSNSTGSVPPPAPQHGNNASGATSTGAALPSSPRLLGEQRMQLRWIAILLALPLLVGVIRLSLIVLDAVQSGSLAGILALADILGTGASPGSSHSAEGAEAGGVAAGEGDLSDEHLKAEMGDEMDDLADLNGEQGRDGTAPPGRAPWSPSRLSPTLAALLEGDSSGAGVAVVLGLLQVQNWLLDLWTVTLGGQELLSRAQACWEDGLMGAMCSVYTQCAAAFHVLMDWRYIRWLAHVWQHLARVLPLPHAPTGFQQGSPEASAGQPPFQAVLAQEQASLQQGASEAAAVMHPHRSQPQQRPLGNEPGSGGPSNEEGPFSFFSAPVEAALCAALGLWTTTGLMSSLAATGGSHPWLSFLSHGLLLVQTVAVGIYMSQLLSPHSVRFMEQQGSALLAQVYALLCLRGLVETGILYRAAQAIIAPSRLGQLEVALVPFCPVLVAGLTAWVLHSPKARGAWRRQLMAAAVIVMITVISPARGW